MDVVGAPAEVVTLFFWTVSGVNSATCALAADGTVQFKYLVPNIFCQ